MRNKVIQYKGQPMHLVLLAGGSEPFKFKIYSAKWYGSDAVMLQVGNKTFQHFGSFTDEYKIIIDYVNLRYQPIISQQGILDNVENIVRGVKALGTV